MTESRPLGFEHLESNPCAKSLVGAGVFNSLSSWRIEATGPKIVETSPALMHYYVHMRPAEVALSTVRTILSVLFTEVGRLSYRSNRPSQEYADPPPEGRNRANRDSSKVSRARRQETYSSGTSNRQLDDDRRPLPLFALQSNPPLMSIDDLFDDGETEPRAVFHQLASIGGAKELPEK